MRPIALLSAAALTLTMCGGGANPSSSPYGAAPAASAAARPAASAAAAATPGTDAAGGMGDYGGYGDYGYGSGGGGGYGGSGSGTATATIAPTGTLGFADNAKLGKILVASNGLALYTYKLDKPNTSTCTAGCALSWPAFVLASGTPVGPAGLKGTLTLITRTDGSKQVAYNGSPLYFYAGDMKAGDANGEGSGDVWFTVKG